MGEQGLGFEGAGGAAAGGAEPEGAPRPRGFAGSGDPPGPRCGHTLTALDGPETGGLAPRLVLFGAPSPPDPPARARPGGSARGGAPARENGCGGGGGGGVPGRGVSWGAYSGPLPPHTLPPLPLPCPAPSGPWPLPGSTSSGLNLFPGPLTLTPPPARPSLGRAAHHTTPHPSPLLRLSG